MSMKTNFCLLAIVLFLSLHAVSQTPVEVFRCIYLEEYVKNASKPLEKKQDEFALDIYADGKSTFYSVHEKRIQTGRDSMLRAGMSASEIINRQAHLPRTHQYFELYKNHPAKGTYRHYDKVVKNYCYEASLPVIRWKVTSETKELMGYKCQKAEGDLYNRTWVAWFTMDIPLSEGPWLLAGLPGFILEAHDTENFFHFHAIEIKHLSGEMKEPADRKAIKCTREEFIAYRKKYYENPESGLSAITGRNIKMMGADGKPLKETKKKLNFLEGE